MGVFKEGKFRAIMASLSNMTLSVVDSMLRLVNSELLLGV